jgi:hypothetical protein
MIRQLVCNQRGSVLLFTTALLVMLLVMGGLAVDLFYLTSVDNELQRAMDFAALAGAATLGFDQSAFGGARLEAEKFGEKNPLKIPVGSTIDLVVLPPDQNPADGDIVFGMWTGSRGRGLEWQRWEPGNPLTPATSVNAVRVQYRRAQVPMSFLNLLFDALQSANPTKGSLTAGAHATAISPICAVPPLCPFPLAVPCQKFMDSNGNWGAGGCGTPIQFISSSGGSPGPQPAGANTAGWAIPYLNEPNPSGPSLWNVIENPAACALDQLIPSGGTVDVNGGMQDQSFERLKTKFTTEWNNSQEEEVWRFNPDGTKTRIYFGKGWGGWVPVVQFGNCADSSTSPNNVSGNDITILTYTKFVMTQVIGFVSGNPTPPRPGWPTLNGAIENGKCAVMNDRDEITWPMCFDSTIGSNYRAIFGYYSCERADVKASGDAGPRACLSNEIKLVE